MILRWRRASANLRIGPVALACLVAVLLGLMIGRAGTSATADQAARELERGVLPLVLDADGVWNSGSSDREPVSDGLIALRRDGDAVPVFIGHDDWLAAYDGVLLQLAGLDMPAMARPVQRQFITAVTISRDAVDVLGHAARVEDPQLRRDLLIEVGRLRQRSEQLTQSARASILDLQGRRADVSPLPPLTSFLEGRRG